MSSKKKTSEPTGSPLPPQVKLLTAHEVTDIVGFTYVSLWKRMKAGQFPAPLEIAPKTLRWRSDEIDAWMTSLPRRQFKGDDTNATD